MRLRRLDDRGFTLIEVVIVIIISGILAGIAFRSGKSLYDAARVKQTMAEMDHLAFAIAGNPDLRSNNERTDFGYVGDVGALPPDLDALVANPGGYATWSGPYIRNDFVQNADDYKLDAWGRAYSYSGGLTITAGAVSTGGGGGCSGPTSSADIVRRLAESESDLLYNQVSGTVYDRNGTPPGPVYADSIRIELTVPDGTGGLLTRTSNVGPGGYFVFDSVAIGNHDLNVIYLPTGDTLRRFVAVVPKSRLYGEHNLSTDLWATAGGGSGLTLVPGSDTLENDCNGFHFWVYNDGSTPVTINGVTLSWTSPTAYYRYVRWGATTIVNHNNPQVASGEAVAFSAAQTVAVGDSVKVTFDAFRAMTTGGPSVDVNNAAFTAVFSDGTSISITTGNCP